MPDGRSPIDDVIDMTMYMVCLPIPTRPDEFVPEMRERHMVQSLPFTESAIST